MDQTHNETLDVNCIVKGTRYERNRKYWLKNREASLRSTLLHNVKSSGRVPASKTVEKYAITPEELLKNWRIYASNNHIPPLKSMKFAVLINNLTLQIGLKEIDVAHNTTQE